MNGEARLVEALAAAAPPTRDGAFVLAVMERAERDRFRRASALSILRGAGLAAAIAALAGPFFAWSAANGEAVQTGLLTAAALFALVGAARFMTERTRAVWDR